MLDGGWGSPRKTCRRILTSLSEQVLEILPASVEWKLDDVNKCASVKGCPEEGRTNVGHIDLTTTTAGTRTGTATMATMATAKAAGVEAALHATAKATSVAASSADESGFGLAVLYHKLDDGVRIRE